MNFVNFLDKPAQCHMPVKAAMGLQCWMDHFKEDRAKEVRAEEDCAEEDRSEEDRSEEVAKYSLCCDQLGLKLTQSSCLEFVRNFAMNWRQFGASLAQTCLRI